MKYILLILLAVSFINCSNNGDHQLEKRLDKISATNDSLQQIIDHSNINSNDSTLAFWKFYKMGIEKPRAFIEIEFRTRTNLIPIEPVLGGTMRFTKVVVLADNWIVGIYEDGHIRGKSLYKYELQQDTTLHFKRLFSVQ